VSDERFINVRKLAAFDLYFRRPVLVLVEFAFGVFGIGALGFVAVVFGLARSATAVAIGVYLLFLGIDYAPLLVYALMIMRKGSAKSELQTELADLGRYRVKYGVQQVLLMVPLFIPMLALSQELRSPRRAANSPKSSASDA